MNIPEQMVNPRLENIKKIKLFDIFGKQVSSKDVSTNQIMFDLSDKTKGIYFLQLIDEEVNFVKKIIIQ